MSAQPAPLVAPAFLKRTEKPFLPPPCRMKRARDEPTSPSLLPLPTPPSLEELPVSSRPPSPVFEFDSFMAHFMDAPVALPERPPMMPELLEYPRDDPLDIKELMVPPILGMPSDVAARRLGVQEELLMLMAANHAGVPLESYVWPHKIFSILMTIGSYIAYLLKREEKEEAQGPKVQWETADQFIARMARRMRRNSYQEVMNLLNVIRASLKYDPEFLEKPESHLTLANRIALLALAVRDGIPRQLLWELREASGVKFSMQ